MSDDTSNSVPEWVPELHDGVHADVYPVSPPGTPPAEVVLDRDSVANGYAECRPPYEFLSLLTENAMSADNVSKVRVALAQLRRTPPVASQRVCLPPFQNHTEGGPRKNSFPLQKPSAKSSLDDWFNKLATGGAFSTAALSKAVPLGPAIVRAVGKVLEMMAARTVPTQRAAWYIRIAVLNECVKQFRPDRPPPSPREFWTKQLCGLLKVETDALRSKKLPAAREHFWDYVIDLARWQADESLLELPLWLDRIAACVRLDLGHGGGICASTSGRVALRAAETFLPEFRSAPGTARLLCESLLAAIDMVGGSAAATSTTAAAAAANAAAAASAASHIASSSTFSNSSAPSRVPPSPTTSSRLPPAVRVVALLRILLPAANGKLTALPAQSGLSTAQELESLVNSASEYLPQSPFKTAKTRSGEEPTNELPALPPAVHFPVVRTVYQNYHVARALEQLPVTGDVESICYLAVKTFSESIRGPYRAAVGFLCSWAVCGPSNVSDFAVPSVCTVVSALAGRFRAELAQSQGGVVSKNGTEAMEACDSDKRPRVPVFQSDIWQFARQLSSCHDKSQEIVSGSDLMYGKESPSYDFEHGAGVNHEQRENLCVSRLLDRLCRLHEFCLSSYMREVTRLLSAGDKSAKRQLIWLSNLPEPVDRCAAESRRSLLRRGQRMMEDSVESTEPNETILSAVKNDDYRSCVKAVRDHVQTGTHSTLVHTVEIISTLDHSAAKSLSDRTRAVLAVLSGSGRGDLAVDWIINILGEAAGGNQGSESKFMSDAASACTAIFAFENLIPMMAACGVAGLALGHLGELFRHCEAGTGCFSKLCSTSSVNQKQHGGNSSILDAFAHVLPSMASLRGIFSKDGDGPLYKLKANGTATESSSFETAGIIAKFISPRLSLSWPKARATSPPAAEAKPVDTPSSLSAVVENDNTFVGDLEFEEISDLKERGERHASLNALVKQVLSIDDNTELCENLHLNSSVTGNAAIGAVILPALTSALESDGSKSERLQAVLKRCLNILNSEQLVCDLSGVGAPLVIELIARLGAVNLTRLPASSDIVYSVFKQPWVAEVLSHQAGLGMVRKLQSRLRVLCGGVVSEAAITKFMMEVVLCVFEDALGTIRVDMSALDEHGFVAQLEQLGYGVADTLFGVLFCHRQACGQLLEFGGTLGRAVSAMSTEKHGRLLAELVSHVAADEDSPLIFIPLIESSLSALALKSSECISKVAAWCGHIRHDQRVLCSELSEVFQIDATCCSLLSELLRVVLSGIQNSPLSNMSDALLGCVRSISEQIHMATSSLKPCHLHLLPPTFTQFGKQFGDMFERRIRTLHGIVQHGISVFLQREKSADEGDGQVAQELPSVAVAVSTLISECAQVLSPSALSVAIDLLEHLVHLAEYSNCASVDVSSKELPDISDLRSRGISFKNLSAEVGTGENATSESVRTIDEMPNLVGEDSARPNASESFLRERSSDAGEGEDNVSGITDTRSTHEMIRISLRARVQLIVMDSEMWFDSQQKRQLHSLYGRETGSSVGDRKLSRIRAFKRDGQEADTWSLLEGYGRGADEEAAVPPSEFHRQGSFMENIVDNDAEPACDLRSAPSRLKRTYSTFACLTVN